MEISMRFQPEQLLLYAVTDRSWLRGSSLSEQVEAALRGGASMVQLREKELPEEDFEREAKEILALCRRFGVPLLINDNVELAARIGADGVHVGPDDMDPREARLILGPESIVGVTARSVEQARAAEAAGADYLGSGAVFGTSTKKDASRMAPAIFRQITKSVSIPVAAIGGITLKNIERLGGLGMKGFAVVSGIFSAEDICEETRLLREKAEMLLGDEERLRLIEERRPVVQCITNMVTVNDCANALLAVGASPTMAHHPEEMEDFSGVIDALVLNMGATEYMESMFLAGRFAGERKDRVPVVIDPVGCAASSFRRRKCLELIREAAPCAIRGNAAEIKALAMDTQTGSGVDALSAAGAEDVLKYAVALSKSSGAIVIASGVKDCVACGDDVRYVTGGSALFKRLTGSGCMLTSLLGAFLSVDPSPESAAACCRFMARCGERAEAVAAAAGGGMGTFHVALMDELSRGG